MARWGEISSDVNIAPGRSVRRNNTDDGWEVFAPAVSSTSVVRLTAGNITTAANTTLVDVTGVSFSYDANSVYRVHIYGAVASAANTTGYGFAFNTSTTFTSLWMTGFSQLANTGTVSAFSSIADDAAVGVTSGQPTNAVAAPLFGVCLLVTNANAGTAQLRFRSETTAAATLLNGLTMVVEKLA